MTRNNALICDEPKVTILMGVWNGAAHLPVQLDSIARQSHRNWHLICSDDGSTDDSTGILRRFASDHPGQVRLINGPGQGFSQNFMSMIAALSDDAGYVCFSDQDDMWHPRKVAQALKRLQVSDSRARLYCGRHHYWYPHRGYCAPSAKRLRPCGLQNALIENVASGNTIMLNPAATALARQGVLRTGLVFAHDWWLYLLITACGGEVYFDNDEPLIWYRQHDANAIGAGRGWAMQTQRKIGVLKGLFRNRVQSNLDALNAVNDMLTPQAHRLVADFAAARQSGGFERLRDLRALGAYRQGWIGHLGYWGAASIGRV